MKHRRIVVDRFGGPEVLQVIEEESPQPRAGEVKLRVLAAGVSLPDIMMREGIHPEKPRPPFTPGWDLVGIVDQVGSGVSRFAPGDVVAALPITGAYTETICLPQEELIPVPAGLDPAEVTSLGLNYVTAWQMLHRVGRVRRGERALVHGGSGGVGTALLQLGGLAGLELYATCSTRVQHYGGSGLDASLLLIPLSGFLPAADPRVRCTIEAVQRELVTDGFVRRYVTDPQLDGLPAGEGVFIPCTLWLANVLFELGRRSETEALLERVLALSSDVGLLSEEYDPVSRRLLGNFPQAFSHVAVLATALQLSGQMPPLVASRGASRAAVAAS